MQFSKSLKHLAPAFGAITVVTCLAASNAAPAANTLEFYSLEPAKPTSSTLARLEPPVGAYLGSYVEEEGEIGKNKMFRMAYTVGGNHAVFFRYHFFVREDQESDIRPFFPDQFMYVAKNSAAAAHIALEPDREFPIEQIDKATVQAFAARLRDAQIPVFLRFASEFNDANNAWSRSPKIYIEKFRMVANVMHEMAPNVAMVWTPMWSSLERMEMYYPGKQYVDWVGITTYNPIFTNGDPNNSAAKINPLERIDAMYKRFSKDHPIQVSEYAAEHHNGLLGDKDFGAQAATKLRLMYWGAYLKYPRIKNINWFSSDTTQDNPRYNTFKPQRRRNYSVLASPPVLEAYRELFRDPYFLQFMLRPNETLANYPSVPNVPVAFPGKLEQSRGKVSGAAWAVLDDPIISKVEYLLDGKPLSSATVMPYRFELDLAGLGFGKHELRAKVFDSKGRKGLERATNFTVLASN